MKNFFYTFVPVFLLSFFMIYFVNHDISLFQFHQKEMVKSEEIEYMANTDSVPSQTNDWNEWSHFIGKTKEEIQFQFGKPTDIQPSFDQYESWNYPYSNDKYIQFGMKNDVVKTVYVISAKQDGTFLKIGDTRDELENKFHFLRTIKLKTPHSTYSIELHDEEFKQKPIILLNDVFIQLYFDTFTNQLSSVRFLSKESLIDQHPYDIVCNGKEVEFSLSNDQWDSFSKANEKDIFYISNVIRNRFGLPSLSWSEELSKVAFSHSEEMEHLHYFDHTSPKQGSLKNRLLDADLHFVYAGENIAMNYKDGASAVEGWMNSEGHRHALLNEHYTNLGVGVYHEYYTQNFSSPLKK